MFNRPCSLKGKACGKIVLTAACMEYVVAGMPGND